MDYSELKELLSAVETVDGILALNELLEIHSHLALFPSLIPLSPSFDMARFTNETNSRVDRSAAERLQEKLFQAAEAALDQAIESGQIPAALLSSTQNILRDAGLNPDLSGANDAERGSGGSAMSPNWLKELSSDLGL